MYLFLALAPIVLSSSVYAADHKPIKTLCDVSKAVIDIPPGQKNLSLPANIEPEYIAIGLGTQNYTCLDTGIYSNVGALAELLDISCLVTSPVFASLRKRAPFPNSDAVWEHEAQVRALLGPERLRLGMHYFENNPTGAAGLTPVFDFRADLLKNDSQAFMAGNKIGDLLAPNTTRDVDWLELSNLQGNLSSFVYRVDTHFGQPPKTCQPGSLPIQVRYSAKYWIFKNVTSADGNSTSYTSGNSTYSISGNSLDASGSLDAGSLNAEVSSESDPDSANLQMLLNYAPVVMGLLGATTFLSLILVALGLMSLCRGRRSTLPTHSATYQPVQLSRAKPPMEGSYQDEPEPYGG